MPGHQCFRGSRNTAVTSTFNTVLTSLAEQTERLSTTFVHSATPLIESASIRPNAALTIRPLIDLQASWKDQQSHPHPFFSPDHRYLLFNSDRSGMAQIYLADHLGL